MRLQMYNLAAEKANQFVQRLKPPLDYAVSKEQAVGGGDLGAQ